MKPRHPAARTAKNALTRRQNKEDTPAPDQAAAHRQVLAWLIEGSNELDIRNGVDELLPGHAVDQLLENAFTHFANVGTIGPPALVATFGFCIEATRDLYRQMKEVGDFAGAMRAVKQLKDLAEQAHALYRPPEEPEPEA